jgi:hypothetical protein
MTSLPPPPRQAGGRRLAEARKRQHPTQVEVADFGDETYVLG